ncbi:MAG: molybdopterin molybdotransferase MoeA [Armatimonadota bacterium]|nr:molybdopterin molybdotransferase MoeA [Armatimonadota bacterium]
MEMILESVPRLGAELLALRDGLGRALAEDVYADQDLPPFDNSAMDGYAVIAADTTGATSENPRALRCIAEEPAGVTVTERVITGTAVKIMTGAPIPPGADAIVPVEDTSAGADGRVGILREAVSGAHVRRAGEDVKRGRIVLMSGVRIGPAEMGALAAVGKAEITVSKAPAVAIVTTGTELVDVSERLGPGRIRDSNSYSLLGQALNAGARVSMVERTADERSELERLLTLAAQTSDIIITSGGVSVGDYDLVKETLAKLGEILFWKVAIKPGKPLAYGRIDGKPLFGLPGNPVSSMVAFDLFVRPALLHMQGISDVTYPRVSGVVSEDLRHKPGRREYVRAVTVWQGEGYVAAPTGDQGSGRLSSMLGANSYIVISEDQGDLRAGGKASVMLTGRR